MLRAGGGENHSFPVRMYVSDLSMDDDFFDRWYDLMPKERRERAQRFKNESDRRRNIGAYALLVHSVTELLGGEDLSDRLNISETADGKPYFTDIPVCFNISHSKDRIAVALSPQKVGCDVESGRRKGLNIAKRFFAAEEYALLSDISDEDERSLEFARLWTLKEAVVKCCGEGIRHELDDFSLVDDEGNRKETVVLPGFDEIYHIREFESESGYCYSVCSTCSDIEERIRRVRLT